MIHRTHKYEKKHKLRLKWTKVEHDHNMEPKLQHHDVQRINSTLSDTGIQHHVEMNERQGVSVVSTYDNIKITFHAK